MPAFQAINLEPEENIDEQIDTTKEIHVDEALKRFQDALKLHAEGPGSREAAHAAYERLFESEVFKYREAQTDYERAERQTNGTTEPQLLESFSAGLDIDAGGADGVAANLSLALYLGYKNYGEFFLDKLKDRRNSDIGWKDKTHLRYHEDDADKVLDNWARALDQDPSDPEVWRRAARFAAALDSGRLQRFCLEAAIELDDDPAMADVEPPSLAEGLAGEQLKHQLKLLSDEVALSHPIMTPWLKKEMPLLIKRHLDPIPYLPNPTQSLTPPSSPPTTKLIREADSSEIDEAAEDNEVVSTWPDLGQELMKHIENTKAAIRTCEAVLQSAKASGELTLERMDQDDPEQLQQTQANNSDGDTNGEKENSVEEGKKVPDEAPETPKMEPKTLKERSQSVASPRKRSQSAAGLQDGGDEEVTAEKRSKRVRRRETANVEEVVDPNTLIANQLQPYFEADHNLFQRAQNILENLGVEDKDVIDRLGEMQQTSTPENRVSRLSLLSAQDLRGVVGTFKEYAARALLNKKEQATLSLSSFLEHAKSGSQEETNTISFDESKGLGAFAEKIDQHKSWMTGADIAFEWVRNVSKSYATEKWSDNMKLAVVQMLNCSDSELYIRISDELEYFSGSQERLENLRTMIPMLFELYVDIYERITNPSSVVDYATRMETKDRLGRWLNIASAYIQLLDLPRSDPICVRFLWASILVSSHSEDPVREHILQMWTSLRDFLAEHEVETIRCPNNVVMPIISPAAADREISTLTTMDFFISLFQEEELENPVHVIETLEPVLNPSSVFVVSQSPTSSITSEDGQDQPEGNPISECAGQGLRDLWKFLLGSSTELRLFLWSRLGDAYQAIDYPTKRFSCILKSIEMIVADLQGETYSKTPDDSRALLLMRTLKSLDELLIQALTMSLNEPDIFDIIDDEHIKSSSSAVAKVNCLLHVVALCEDEFRVGITTTPSNNSTFQNLLQKLREMQVRAWCLQYTLIKAGIAQQGSFISPENELADYLAAVHNVIGLRKFCKVSNKIFLKMMRAEILKLKGLENWEDYLEQVLYDLYGLKLGVGTWEVQDHACPHEPLEKQKTMQLVEKVMILANRMSMKDLLKSDLKTTIDHMQQTIGQLKSTPQMIHNLRNFTEILKKPIHPMRLYRAWSGSIDVDSVSVNVPEAALANHGWFFLLGMIALTKFKGVDLNRRQTPGATDDLRIGATFLRLQLQFTADRWDAWFRLAECFDYELDEAVLWTADKINKDRSDLVKFQRNAIHCYTLALSHSVSASTDKYEGDPLHDLYHKFGMRLYASSREPFAMEPFLHSEQERYFIEANGNGTFRRIVHDEMTPYKVWKFAAKLFKKALRRQASNWKNAYMLAKCYWKMYRTPEEDLDRKDMESRVKLETLLDALKNSVHVACNASRSRRSEPILEPHYKIVSILHKLVISGDLPSKDAAAMLSDLPFGVALDPEDHFASFSEPEDWEEYVILNLTKLRDKDKSNWQHRIIMRHASILFHDTSAYENDADATVAAKAAFQILRESMFTKTMVMNVWKCDAERPGRHHVYTTMYTQLMTKLLVIMQDRTNMEQLLRRLRKKGVDFYHFNDLWHTCCLAYIKLLRDTYNIPVPTDEVFKTMSSEEFEIVTDRITEWAAGDGPHTSTFSCMRDSIEIKKLNASLTRAGPIDDLINDCYSQIFAEVAPSLPGLDPAKIIEQRKEAKEATAPRLEALEALEGTDGKPSNPLNGLLNPSEGHLSSRAATPTPNDSEKPESGTRTRRPGIRRPEVLRKAEAAVMRSMEPKAGTTKSRVGSVSSKRGSQTPNVAMSEEEDTDEGPDAQVLREAEEGMNMDMKDVNSEAGDKAVTSDADSLGNDGDDESDLSDAPEGYDEEMPIGLMFPHLQRADTASESSGEEADSESEGDETVHDEAEEDEHEGDATIDHEGHEADDEQTELRDDDGDMDMADATIEEDDEGGDRVPAIAT